MGATCCKESKNNDTATPKKQIPAKPVIQPDKHIRPKVKLIQPQEPLPDTAPVENPFTPPSQKKPDSPSPGKGGTSIINQHRNSGRSFKRFHTITNQTKEK